jgi:hypothetical protein
MYLKTSQGSIKIDKVCIKESTYLNDLYYEFDEIDIPCVVETHDELYNFFDMVKSNSYSLYPNNVKDKLKTPYERLNIFINLASYFGVNKALNKMNDLIFNPYSVTTGLRPCKYEVMSDKDKLKSILNNYNNIFAQQVSNNKILNNFLLSYYNELPLNVMIDIDCYYQMNKYHNLFDPAIINYTKSKFISQNEFQKQYNKITYNLFNDYIKPTKFLYHCGHFLNDIINNKETKNRVNINLFYINTENTENILYNYIISLIEKLLDKYTLIIKIGEYITTIIINEILINIQFINTGHKHINDLVDEFDFSYLKMYYDFESKNIMISSECLKSQISGVTKMYNYNENSIMKTLNAGFKIADMNFDNIFFPINKNNDDNKIIYNINDKNNIKNLVSDIKKYMLYTNTLYNNDNIWLFYDPNNIIIRNVVILGSFSDYERTMMLVAIDKNNCDWVNFKKYMEFAFIRKIELQKQKIKRKIKDNIEYDNIFTISELQIKTGLEVINSFDAFDEFDKFDKFNNDILYETNKNIECDKLDNEIKYDLNKDNKLNNELNNESNNESDYESDNDEICIIDKVMAMVYKNRKSTNNEDIVCMKNINYFEYIKYIEEYFLEKDNKTEFNNLCDDLYNLNYYSKYKCQFGVKCDIILKNVISFEGNDNEILKIKTDTNIHCIKNMKIINIPK